MARIYVADKTTLDTVDTNVDTLLTTVSTGLGILASKYTVLTDTLPSTENLTDRINYSGSGYFHGFLLRSNDAAGSSAKGVLLLDGVPVHYSRANTVESSIYVAGVLESFLNTTYVESDVTKINTSTGNFPVQNMFVPLSSTSEKTGIVLLPKPLRFNRSLTFRTQGTQGHFYTLVYTKD